MERIIKIFRRVMLAVIIIPFLSVFAMPDYSAINAADSHQFNGLTMWDAEGNYLTTDSTASPEHQFVKNQETDFAGGRVKWNNDGFFVIKSINLGENAEGQSLVNAQDSGVNDIRLASNSTLAGTGDFEFGKSIHFSTSTSNTVESISIGGSVYSSGDITIQQNADILAPYRRYEPVRFDVKGDVNVNNLQLTDVVSFSANNVMASGNINIADWGGFNAGTINASGNVTLKAIDMNIRNGVVSGGTFSLSRVGNVNQGGMRYFNIASTDGYGIQANVINIESTYVGGNPGSFSSYNITGKLGAFNVDPVVSASGTGARVQLSLDGSRYSFLPSQVISNGTNAVIQSVIDGEIAKRAMIRSGGMTGNAVVGKNVVQDYPYATRMTDLYTGGFGDVPKKLQYKMSGAVDSAYETLSEGSVLLPGTYDVQVQQASDLDGWRSGSTTTSSLTINKGTLTSADFQDIEDTHIYDGTGHGATPAYIAGLVGTNPNIQVSYQTFEGQDIADTPKDAGAYRVFATVPADGDNYLATASPIEVGTITILPANVPSEHINVGDLSHVYDGKSHEATVSLDNKYGEITSVKYEAEDGSIIDKPTNAGRYEVLLSTASKNYVPLANEVVGVLNITKAAPTAKDFKFDSEKTYTGSKIDAKVLSTNDLMTTEAAGALTVKYNGDTNQPINAGKYDVTVETAGGANYNSVSLNLGAFEITKAAVTKADLTGKANNATYDGKQHSASYDWKAGMVGAGALTLTYKGAGYNSTVAPVTAGTYTVYASAPAGANYQALESVKVADLKISKANLIAKNFNDVSANYIYDFASHPAKVAYLPGTEGTAPIMVTYKTAAGKTVSGAPTNAGTYDVYAQALKSGANYNAMAKPVKVGTIKIAKADKPLPQIKVSNNKFTYDGKSHQANVTMDKKYGDLSISYKDEKGKVIAKPTNAGVYQIIANTVSDNFEELHGITVGELTIEGLAPKSSEFTFTKTGTYNGKSQSAKVAYAPGVTEAMAGKMTVHYVDAKGNKTNSITNAGTYKVYVSTTGGTNFRPVNNLLIGSMKIAKAQVVSDEFSVKDAEVTFDGQSQSPNVTLPAKYGDITKIEYRDENGKIYDKVENPGKYDILVTTKGTANYAGADRLVVGTFTIDEQTPTPTPAPNDNGGNAGGGTTPAASTVVPASGPATYNATTTVPATTAGTTTNAVAPATQTPTTGTQTQTTPTPAADNATIRHGAITDPLHGPEEVSDPVSSVAQKDTQGLSNYTIAGIWMAVAVALAGAFYIGMRWMQVGRKRHLIQK